MLRVRTRPECEPHPPGILDGRHLPGGSQPEMGSPEETHSHLRWYSPGAPGTLSGQDRGGDYDAGQTGTVCAPSTWYCLSCADLGRAQNSCPAESVPLRSARDPEWLRPGKCTKFRARFRQCPCRAPWSLSSGDQGSTHCLALGKASVVHPLQATPTHASDICLQCPSLPTTRLNK